MDPDISEFIPSVLLLRTRNELIREITKNTKLELELLTLRKALERADKMHEQVEKVISEYHLSPSMLQATAGDYANMREEVEYDD
jgi:hypothetical protein